eukprot:TRINITY_DN2479_c0_g1_i1.p1 TRINITY_DN2479_c0_g1~~TRINITY_DN2479_c0_g1_i1.p1  ORF type:complete len:292 (+),score=98.68 TRINITY_DN2479_c0_g1_i1:176-1051(+)
MPEFGSANFPTTEDGKVYHLGIKKGDVNNLIVTCGDISRAKYLSTLLDESTNPNDELKLIEIQSERLFYFVNGHYKGVPITIGASLMGYPNMDFFIRELRAVVEGPMALIRIGTTGTPKEHIPLGSIVVAESCRLIQRNFDHFRFEKNDPMAPPAYHLSEKVYGDEELSDAIESELKKTDVPYFRGCNVSADTFYGSQGRQTPHFRDDNENLVDWIVEQDDEITNLEMETFHLYDLCKLVDSEKFGKMYASSMAIVIAQRRSDEFIIAEKKHQLEIMCGKIALETLIKKQL